MSGSSLSGSSVEPTRTSVVEPVAELGTHEVSVPVSAPFVDRPTLDLVAMRRERERIIEAEIAAGRMADWPDSFRGFPLGVEDQGWYW